MHLVNANEVCCLFLPETCSPATGAAKNPCYIWQQTGADHAFGFGNQDSSQAGRRKYKPTGACAITRAEVPLGNGEQVGT
jgi:hypothetical protein